MNSYSTNQTSLTIGSGITIAGILASQFLLPTSDYLENRQRYIEEISKEKSYKISSTPSTFNTLALLSTTHEINLNLDFENVISEFYASLLANQIPLGDEFEKILYDNLWELYES